MLYSCKCSNVYCSAYLDHTVIEVLAEGTAVLVQEVRQDSWCVYGNIRQ